MKIVASKPPEDILAMILGNGMRPTSSVVYTVGDTIYVPNGNVNLPDHLIEHERVHFIQQGDDIRGWWGRYVTDPYFRIEQEAEAYGMQYKVICRTVKDRNRRNSILLELAGYLSSPIYGSVIGRNDARKMIMNKANVK